jgi:hypothetical protein
MIAETKQENHIVSLKARTTWRDRQSDFSPARHAEESRLTFA